MKALVPQDLELESSATLDGFTYTVRVLSDASGYRAHLTWQRHRSESVPMPHDQTTPVFSNPRSAMNEGQALAEEFILAWRH